MARAAACFQNAPRASQSHLKCTQSQRPHRSWNSESDEEEDEIDGGAGADMDEEHNREQGNASAVSMSTSPYREHLLNLLHLMLL
jgi:hypothetical protein